MPETGTPFDKLFLILEEFRGDLTEIKDRLARLEGREPQAPAPAPTPAPPVNGALDLYSFVRPAKREADRWPFGADMKSADLAEAIERALHGVNWRGGKLGDKAYEEAWAEIEALKAGDWRLIGIYGPAGANLDPALAGYALLTGRIQTVAHDGGFSGNADARRALAGETVQSFLDDQFRVAGVVGVG